MRCSGADAGLAALKQLLIERTRAIPSSWRRACGRWSRRRRWPASAARYRLTQPVHAIQVPPTVQAMLAARIDRLAPDDKRLLQIGRGHRQGRAVRPASGDRRAARGGASRRARPAAGGRVPLRDRPLPDLEYTFKHALTHEVAYGGLLQERRRALHARIVDAIERLHPERLGEQAERLAHHAAAGRAVGEGASLPSPRRSQGGGAICAPRGRCAWFEQALEALAQLPESRRHPRAGLRSPPRDAPGAAVSSPSSDGLSSTCVEAPGARRAIWTTTTGAAWSTPSWPAIRRPTATGRGARGRPSARWRSPSADRDLGLQPGVTTGLSRAGALLAE